MAYTPATIANNLAILKVFYAQGLPKDVISQAGPFFSLMNKQQAGGKQSQIPIKIGYPQSGGNTFAIANANAYPSQYGSFYLPEGLSYPALYNVNYVDNEAIYASRGGENAFAEIMMEEITGMRAQHMRDINRYIWRDGSGALGKVLTIPSSTTVTLSLFTDGNNFDRYGTYVSSTTKFSTIPTNAAVLAGQYVDYSARTATLTFTTANPSGIAIGDYLFRQGYYATAAGVGLTLGVAAFVPDTAPTSTTFLTQDRSINPNALAGFRYDASQSGFINSVTNMLYSMKQSNYRVGNFGNNLVVWCPPIQIQRLQNETANSLVRLTPDQSAIAYMGFETYRTSYFGVGSVEFAMDPEVPGDHIYILANDASSFFNTAMCTASPGYWNPGLGMPGLPGSIDPGVPIILNPTTMEWQIRAYTYGTYVNFAPGTCGVIYNCPLG